MHVFVSMAEQRWERRIEGSEGMALSGLQYVERPSRVSGRSE